MYIYTLYEYINLYIHTKLNNTYKWCTLVASMIGCSAFVSPFSLLLELGQLTNTIRRMRPLQIKWWTAESFGTKIDNLRDLGGCLPKALVMFGRCRFHLLPSQSEIPVSCRRMGLENCCLWPFWHVWFFGDFWYWCFRNPKKTHRLDVLF